MNLKVYIYIYITQLELETMIHPEKRFGVTKLQQGPTNIRHQPQNSQPSRTPSVSPRQTLSSLGWTWHGEGVLIYIYVCKLIGAYPTEK